MVSMASGTSKVVHVAAKHIRLLLLFGLVCHSTCFLAGQLQMRWGSVQADGSPDKNLSAPPWHYTDFSYLIDISLLVPSVQELN